MEITINGKDYKLNFGIKFIREADKFTLTKLGNGMEFSAGLGSLLSKILNGDMVAFFDIVYLATCTNSKRPSKTEIDEYLDSLNTDEFDTLYNEVMREIEQSNSGKRVMLKAKEDMKMTEERQAEIMKNLM